MEALHWIKAAVTCPFIITGRIVRVDVAKEVYHCS